MYKKFKQYIEEMQSQQFMPMQANNPQNQKQQQAKDLQQIVKVQQAIQSGSLSGDAAIKAVQKLKDAKAQQDLNAMKVQTMNPNNNKNLGIK